MVNKTLIYYNQNADSFIEGTVSVNFKEVQDKFLQMLSGKKILDFGCGSGRDTMYFLKSGFDVTATDGSEELCKYASEYTGIHVKQMLFQDLDEVDYYDGIWACSSILHLSKNELRIVMNKMSRAYITDNTRRYRIKQSGEKYVGLFCSVPSFNLHEKEDIRSR